MAEGKPLWADNTLWVPLPPIGNEEPSKCPTLEFNTISLTEWYIGSSTLILSIVKYPIISSLLMFKRSL